MKRFVLLIFLVLLSAVAGLQVADAHVGTGTQQINNEDIGPYRLFVWSDPEPPVVDEPYHVAVALTESLPNDPSGFAGDAVLEAAVMVTLTHADSGETVTAPATHENAVNKIYYEAVFDLPRAGEWRVDLTVQGAQGTGQGSYVDVIETASFNWMAIVAGVAAVLLAVAAVLIYWRTQPRRLAEAGAH